MPITLTGSAGITASGNITGGNLITTGLVSVTGNVTGGNLTTGGLASVTGNITGGNLNTVGLISATGNVTGGNLITAGLVSVTGNITGGNLITAGLLSVSSITKTGSNAVGNIGSSTSFFNTVFAKATSAQYADLAEMYLGDKAYKPGTVMSFGGDCEVTQSQVDCDRRVAGVVSTDPAYIMNSVIVGDNAVPVALVGKVPTQVIGPVSKGDMMVSAGNGCARAEPNPPIGSVIGKSLENFQGMSGVINIVVGRL